MGLYDMLEKGQQHGGVVPGSIVIVVAVAMRVILHRHDGGFRGVVVVALSCQGWSHQFHCSITVMVLPMLGVVQVVLSAMPSWCCSGGVADATAVLQ